MLLVPRIFTRYCESYMFNIGSIFLILVQQGLPKSLTVFLQLTGSGEILYESAFCAMLEVPQGVPMYELSFLFFFFIPMLVILLMYTRIGLKIRSRSRHSLGKRVEGTVHGETKRSQSRKSIIRMLSEYLTICPTYVLRYTISHFLRFINPLILP